jgi:hypothetical protein
MFFEFSPIPFSFFPSAYAEIVAGAEVLSAGSIE